MKKDNQSLLLALAAVILWSTVGSAFSLSLKFFSPSQLLFFSNLTALIFLGIVILLRSSTEFKQTLSKKAIVRSAIMGFLNPFAYYLVLLRAYSVLPAQEAVALNYIWPVVLVLLSIPVLKQRISAMGIFSMLISFAGTVVIATQGNIFSMKFENPAGTAMALGSSVFWAFYWLLNMKDKRDSVSNLFLNFFFGMVYITLFVLFSGGIQSISAKGLTGAVYIGLFEMGLTFVVWLTALKKARNTAAVGNLVFLSPFLSLMFISTVIGEKILLSTFAGLILIIAGIMIQQYNAAREKL